MLDRQGRRKYLNHQERRTLLGVIEDEPCASRRAFGLTLYFAGCRISEALNVTVERVDLRQRSLVLETLKQRRRGIFRPVPIPDRLCALLGELVINREPSAQVWSFSRSTAYRFVKAWMAEAGIRGVMACPKGMRHGMGVACLEHQIPLTKVQKWMGHARLETTAIYLDVSGEEERRLARRLWREN